MLKMKMFLKHVIFTLPKWNCTINSNWSDSEITLELYNEDELNCYYAA